MYPIQIETVVRSARRLYVASVILPNTQDGQSPIRLEIKRILDQLNLISLVHQCPTIAVGGLQGAGKTALIRTLYELGFGLLPESGGRDERTPIRILEHPSNKPEARALFTNEDGEIGYREIDVTQLCRGARQVTDVFAFELRVPKRYFESTDDPQHCRSWLLLPGVEENNQEWSRRVAIAMKAASACLLVVSPSRMSHARQQNFLEGLRDAFGPQAMAVAVTNSGESSDRNQSIVKQVRELLDLPEEFVVATDASLTSKRDWIPALLQAVDRSMSSRADSARLQELETLLAGELSAVLQQLDEYLEMDARTSGGLPREIAPVINTFKAEVASLREELQRALRRELRRRRDQQMEGWLQFVEGRSVKEKFVSFFSDHLSQRLKYQEKLRDLFQKSDVGAVRSKAMKAALNRRYEIVSQGPAVTGAKAVQQLKPAPAAPGSTPGQGKELKIQLQEQDIANLGYLSGQPDILPTSRLRKMVQILPLLAVEAARQTDQAGDRTETQRSHDPQSHSAVNPKSSMEKVRLDQERLLKAFGVLVSIDLTAEAKIDLPRRVASALGLPSALAAAATAGAAAPAIVAPAPAVAAAPAVVAPAIAAPAVPAVVAPAVAAPAATHAVAAPVAHAVAAPAAGATPVVPAAAATAAGAVSLGAVMVAAAASLVLGALVYREVVRHEFDIAEWGTLALDQWAQDMENTTLDQFDEGMGLIEKFLIETLSTRHGLDRRLGDRERLAAAKAHCHQSLVEVHREILRRRSAMV